ncbi:5650_t:CDS:2 [Funneliformis mosseae]|uniref:5650_t:CDS:1 n=1 Tax=Funneliformis mosseae TaxID=27381 RepID=A0A9N9NET4_FUNMO|nr:5650_t:CDS:2 [Funneliformis mosseae]
MKGREVCSLVKSTQGNPKIIKKYTCKGRAITDLEDEGHALNNLTMHPKQAEPKHLI